MSGGRWDYASHKIEQTADDLSGATADLLRLVAKIEHLVDWAESGDTSRAEAEPAIYDLCVTTFERLFGYEDPTRRCDAWLPGVGACRLWREHGGEHEARW